MNTNTCKYKSITRKPKRGEIYYVDLGSKNREDSIQGGARPCLIIQNDIGNKYSPTIIIAPLTSKVNKKPLPTHVIISKEELGTSCDSLVILEQITTVPLTKIESHYIGKINEKTMLKINEAIEVSLGLKQTINLQDIISSASNRLLEAEILYNNCMKNDLFSSELFQWSKQLKKQRMKELNDLCDKYGLDFHKVHIKYNNFIKNGGSVNE